MESAKKPGWYPHHDVPPGQMRYWDGEAWTDMTTGGERKSMSVGGQIVIALLILAAVGFGALNAMDALAR